MPGMWTDEQRAAAAERARKFWSDPARKAARTKNIRKAVRKAMKDPEKRANLVAAVKRGGVTRTTPIEERFWANVNKDGPTQEHMKTCCWLWTGPKQHISVRNVEHRTYGLIHKGGKYGSQMLVHRYSYELHKGKPGKKQVQHRCNVALCVRPGHLKLGTPQDNSDDAKSHGRFSKRSKR